MIDTIITSKQNNFIKQFRIKDQAFTVESAKLVSEAVKAGFTPIIAMFTEKCRSANADLFAELAKITQNCFVITPHLAEYISDTKTPQGIFVKFAKKHEIIQNTWRRTVILDGVQDPGNVGAILRSCEAFGFDCIAFSDNSVDAFNPKVIRASAGSVFRLPCTRGDLCEIIATLKQSGFIIYAADLDETAVPIRQLSTINSPTAVVIGSEGKGISAEIAELCDHKVYIPIKGAQSLNAAVAAGIICYEMGIKQCRN